MSCNFHLNGCTSGKFLIASDLSLFTAIYIPNQLDNQPPQDIINRPESRLEVDTEGAATLSDPSAPPQRLPPLKGSQDGDGLEGYRQDLNLIEGSSTPGGSEVNTNCYYNIKL